MARRGHSNRTVEASLIAELEQRQKKDALEWMAAQHLPLDEEKSERNTIMQQKKWQDLMPAQQRAIVVGGFVQIALLVAALVDIRGRSADEVRGSKRWWTAALFVNFVGPIAYFLFGRKGQASIS
jgi:hypothetical protein